MPKFRKLKAYGHAEEYVTHGTETYRVDNDGSVMVPEEAVGPLTHIGSFVLADVPAPEAPKGQVFVKHDDDAASFSFEGQNFDKNEHGHFAVPAHAVEHLMSHGFYAVDKPAAAAPVQAEESVLKLKVPK